MGAAEIIEAVIERIPEFMRYFALGFLFLDCMNFAGSMRREEKIEYLVISCLALSFVLTAVSDFFAEQFSSIRDNQALSIIMAVCIAVVSGLVAGRLSKTRLVNRIIFLVFHCRVMDDFLVDLWEQTTPKEAELRARIKIKGDGHVYAGQVQNICNLLTSPIIILSYYKRFDSFEAAENDGKKAANDTDGGQKNKTPMETNALPLNTTT
ncbi:MAG: hypothetical protein IJT94_11385 [Oscillibacter sp.]|nr:hypothetical protein [Oscillibacter sp.]